MEEMVFDQILFKSLIGGSGKAKLGRRNNKSKGTEDILGVLT